MSERLIEAGFNIGCECNSCIALLAAERLVEAGICPDYETGYVALLRVLPVPSSLTSPVNIAILKSLGGFHGATLYRILLARRS